MSDGPFPVYLQQFLKKNGKTTVKRRCGGQMAFIAGGYAYILLDIFNSSPLDEVHQITTEHFRAIKMDELLSMNRTNGFYQMIEMMQVRLPAA